MDEAACLNDLEAFVDHLSGTVTINGVPERISKLLFYSGATLLECIPLVGKWPGARHRARRAFDRYHGQVSKIRALVGNHVGSAVPSSVNIAMEDGEAFENCLVRKTSGGTLDLVVFGSTQHGPCACTTLALEIAIMRADLFLVEEMVRSGVDINSHSYRGPVLGTAITMANTSLDSDRAGCALGVMSWLVSRPGIRWDDSYTSLDGVVTTVALEALGVDSRILRLLPWHADDIHFPIEGGNNLLCSHLIKTRHNPMFMLQRVELLLAHGSGTLTLSVNDAGARACDLVASNLSLGVLLRQVERETAEAVRALLLQCISVRALIAIVFSYYSTFV